jgi:hypothetical protein
MVLRDSFLYAAEPYRFEVFNVANPRQPVWMGRCNSIDMVLCGLDIEGHFAYEIAGPFGLAIINIVDPANPYVVSTTTGHSTYAAGVAVRDTFAYVPSAYETLYSAVRQSTTVAGMTSACGIRMRFWGALTSMFSTSRRRRSRCGQGTTSRRTGHVR